MSVVWTVRLAARAEIDFSDILVWTAEKFGKRQAVIYAETLTLAIEALHEGPDPLGAKSRDDIDPGVRTLHIARKGRNGRHFVVYREAQSHCIDVLRLLHDSMDLARHVQEHGRHWQ